MKKEVFIGYEIVEMVDGTQVPLKIGKPQRCCGPCWAGGRQGPAPVFVPLGWEATVSLHFNMMGEMFDRGSVELHCLYR